MLLLPMALLSLLSAPRPLLPTTARARPVALSAATWDELEAQLPSSLAPEPLIIDSALVHDRVNMHAIPRARRLAPASCEPRVPEAQGRLPRRASLEPLARACVSRGAPPPALPPAPPRLHRTPPCVTHHARCPHTRLRLVHGRVPTPGAREAHAHGRRPRALPRAQWLVPVIGGLGLGLGLS